MRFFLRKKVFSLKNDYYIKNSIGETQYLILRSFFSKRKYKIFNKEKKLLAKIEKKLFRFSPEHKVYLSGGKEIYIKKKFGLFTNIFKIICENDEYIIDGDVVAREYTLFRGDKKIAIIANDIQSVLRGYDINISKYEENPMIIICIVLVIHLCHYSNFVIKYKKAIAEFRGTPIS